MNDVVANLVERRRELGLSQDEVGQRMGVSQSAISYFESHSEDPYLSTIMRYARAVEARIHLEVCAEEHDDGEALWEIIAKSLRTRIETAPTTQLPSESRLMKQFGVARNTVRRALAELEREGLVEVRPGRGRYPKVPETPDVGKP